jgi:hypothetical protein
LSSPSSSTSLFPCSQRSRKPKVPGVSQPKWTKMYHDGWWMVSDQETVFCWIPVP